MPCGLSPSLGSEESGGGAGGVGRVKEEILRGGACAEGVGGRVLQEEEVVVGLRVCVCGCGCVWREGVEFGIDEVMLVVPGVLVRGEGGRPVVEEDGAGCVCLCVCLRLRRERVKYWWWC